MFKKFSSPLKLSAVAAALCVAGLSHAQSATVVNGVLMIATTDADQSVKVEVGPSAGMARVFGVAGVADGQAFAGVSGLNIATGAGKDAVEVNIQTASSFNVVVDTNGGEAEAKVKWQVLGGAAVASTLDLNSSGGTMTLAAVEFESKASRPTVNFDLGVAQTAFTKVLSTVASSPMNVKVRGAATKSLVEIESSATALTLDLANINTAAVSSELIYAVAQKVAAPVSAKWNIVTGGADDDVIAKLSAPGSTVTQTGSVNTGAGNDDVHFETEGFSTTTGLKLNGGAGDDFLAVFVKGRFQMSPTLQIAVNGGLGNDKLIVFTDTGIWGTGTVPDLEPLINCGAGEDEFKAFGVITSCEKRM